MEFLGVDFDGGAVVPWGGRGYGASTNPGFQPGVVAEDGCTELENGFADRTVVEKFGFSPEFVGELVN